MKKSNLYVALLSAAGALLVASPLVAADGAPAAKTEAKVAPGQLIRVKDKDSAWAQKERATYPLKTCVVSGEKLGSMGKAAEYIYRTEGQPDRLVVFCCSGCTEDFMADPAAHLARIDEAARGSAAGKKTSEGVTQ